MGFLKPEAEYVFNFDGITTKALVGVDKVKGVRVHYDSQEIKTVLNYIGTGAEFSTIEAELVFEEWTRDTPSYKKAELIYKLPDVNEYVLVAYRYEVDPDFLIRELTVVGFIPRI